MLLRSCIALFALLLHFMPAEALFNCPGARVIFVNNCNTPGPGDGSYDDPYTSLDGVNGALTLSNECDVIYVFPGDPYIPTGSFFLLKNNQRLLGTTTQLYQRCPDCVKPVLSNTGGTVVRLATNNNNEVSGFEIEGDTGIQGDTGVANFTSETIITNNDITTTVGSAIIFLTQQPIGTIYIDNCNIYADAVITTSPAISLTRMNRGNVIITNNLISATSALNGYRTGIQFFSPGGSFSLLVQNNTIGFQGGTGSRGLTIINNPPGQVLSAFVNATVSNNFFFTLDSTAAAGIFVQVPFPLIPTQNRTLCLTLTENIADVPNGIPGYLLWNSNFDGAFSLFEEANDGSFMINNETANSGPFTGTAYPVTFTNWRCPEQDGIIRFLETLPMP